MNNGSLKSGERERERGKTRIKTFIAAVTLWIFLPFLLSVTNALGVVTPFEAALSTVT
jgi:hypothetical protein